MITRWEIKFDPELGVMIWHKCNRAVFMQVNNARQNACYRCEESIPVEVLTAARLIENKRLKI